MRVQFSKKERGATVLIFTLLLSFALLPIMGLAVDVSYVYFAKSRIRAAVDAAALAGGRSLSVGLDFASQKANAEGIANQYFAANYPTNFLGSTNIKVNSTAQQTGDLYRTVYVNASADVPLSFMRMVGYRTATVSADAQTSRRDINIVLVLDRSGSMQKACGTMKAVAQNFVDGFTNGRDTLGLTSFVATANEADFPPTKNFKTQTPKNLSQVLGTLTCNGSTNSSEALSKGLVAVKKAAQPGTLNVMIFFTDGYPHGFTAVVQRKNAACADPVEGDPGYYKPDPPVPATYHFVKSTFTAKTGMVKPVTVNINQGDPGLQTISGCAVNTLANVKANYMGFPASDGDEYTPDTDLYGNATDLYSTSTISDNGALATYNLTKTGSLIDMTVGNAWLVSKSTAYDAARKVRAAGVTLYTIGLDGNGGVDSKLLLEMANDRNSDQFNQTQPIGKYAYASDAGQLAAAFNSIKSELLRLAQ